MFEYNIYTTWRDFSTKSNRCHQIDHILTNDRGRMKTTDCKVSRIGVTSNHSSLITILIIREVKRVNKLTKRITRYELLMNESYQHQYNQALAKLINPDDNMSNFYSALTTARREVLSCKVFSDPGWFETSKNELILLINERNKLLLATRLSPNNLLKQKCIDARNNIRDTIKAVKSRWMSTLAE